MNKITEERLKKKTDEFDIETIYALSLRNQGIFDLGCIGFCINLVQLDLSKNNLSSVMALRSLVMLKFLNLSENRLSALSGLEQLKYLECLNVCGNFLNSVDCLLPLTKIETLETLTIQDTNSNLSNPVMDTYINDPYKFIMKVKEMVPSITCLDGMILSAEGKEFNDLCFKYNDSQLQNSLKRFYGPTSTPKTYDIKDPPFVRIGFEENETFNKAKEISDDCEKMKNEAFEMLKQMKQEFL